MAAANVTVLLVLAGNLHWRAFIDQANQQREARQTSGIATWWQPSDLPGRGATE